MPRRARSFLVALSVVAAVAVLPACRSAPPPLDLRERAYRANNRGIAHLERFEYPEAAAAFRDALAIDGGLAIARLNLSIALLYGLDLSGAERDASEAARLLPEAPQPPYIRGLIARAENRPADARREFERVRQIDAGDVGTNVNLGQILLEERRYEEAIPLLRAAADAEAVNVTAIYNLGLALTRAGRDAEGRDMLARAQALRSVGYSITYGNGYLEQGAYAEAIGSTGAEPGLVDARVPRNSFGSSVIAPLPGAAGGGVALIDADGDSDLDLFVATGAGERLFENQGQGGWRDLTSATGLAERRGGIGAAAADFDNDGRADLLVLRREGSALYRNEGDGRFSDVTAAAGLQKIPYYPAAGAWADIDHDGDADLVVSGQEAADGQRRPRKPGELDTPSSYVTVALQVFRNNGNGTFAEIAAASGLGAVVRAVAIAPTDFDNRRDLDLLVANAAGAPLLFRNLRDGRFRDDAAGAGLADILGAIRVTAMATGDVNKDDFPDFFFAGEPNGVFAMSDGRGRFRAMPAPDGAAGAAAQLFDYDNDGLLDLLVSAEPGTRLWRNTAGGWNEVTASALTGAAKAGAWSPRGVAIADLDRNGTSDIVMLTAGNVGVLLNDGDPDRRAQRVQLKGRVSNRLGIGAKVQLRAGSLSTRVETSAATPMVAPADIVFGLGSRPSADAVRVLWPSGILQSETPSAAPAAPAQPALVVEELDRKPSSCPVLFTWNGERFEFVTDFLGAGEMGYWEAPGVRNAPDPTEYVRIRGDQLRARDGRLELRITNELEETLFLDRLQLHAIAHPSHVEVYPNEGMTAPPKDFRLFAVADQWTPRAIDDDGRDMTARVAATDRIYPDQFALEPIRGYAKPHALTLDLGPGVAEGRSAGVLLLTAWTDYAFSSDNVAASQAGLTHIAPALDVKDSRGRWRRAIEQIGLPVGRPQTIPVDLSAVLRPGEHVVRLVTSMRVYWDRVAAGRLAPAGGMSTARLDSTTAGLRSRGFSAELRPEGTEPLIYDYSRVTRSSPWKILTGQYTREGDVRELLASSDDMFVIAAPGDEVALQFDAEALPPLPQGWTRTFLLFADGYSKEMDINSATPDHVEPLPFHRMSAYPYPPAERYPDTPAHQRYRETYNTRRIVRPIPRFDQLPPSRRLEHAKNK